MIICAAGDVHGAIDKLYANILDFQNKLGIKFDCVLQVGDFGIWPDPNRVDKETREHSGAGDFPRWHKEGVIAPIPTYFVKGNHEDFDFLKKKNLEGSFNGLHYITNGTVKTLGGVRIGGIGGCYRHSSSDCPVNYGVTVSPKHYSSSEVRMLKHHGNPNKLDILLLHDAPDGILIPNKREPYVTQGVLLRGLIEELQPRVGFFGHHHQSITTTIGDTPCIGLNLIGYPGNLVAWDSDTGKFLGTY